MFNNETMKFLAEAKRNTYAGENFELMSFRPESRDLIYKEKNGNLMYYDSYVGGKFFQGQEVLYKEGKPIWSMVYSGREHDENSECIPFLKECLLMVTPELPYRGPESHENDEYKYVMHLDACSSPEMFSGSEYIYKKNSDGSAGKTVFRCYFMGGLTME